MQQREIRARNSREGLRSCLLPHPCAGQVRMGKWRIAGLALTVAAVAQVGPDDVLLGEAEHPEASPPHGGVQDNPGVCHHLGAFIEPSPAGDRGGSDRRGQRRDRGCHGGDKGGTGKDKGGTRAALEGTKE